MRASTQGSRPVHYPESDGRPLAETEIHLQQIFDLVASLRFWFREQPEIHVSSNLLLYYEEGEPSSCVAPDIMVIRGIPPGFRRTYKTWEEGKVPDVVIEVTSAGTRLEDRGTKKETYAMLGVPEYFMVDPTSDYLKPPFRAFRLQGEDYVELVGHPMISAALCLELRMVDGFLRLADPQTGALLPIQDEMVRAVAEAYAARTAAEEQVKAAEERANAAETQAKVAKEQVSAAEERARAAEEELARLRRFRKK